MADGLCGPSNPLQNLQKHSTVDRTLQQDRLTARQSPSQGFRSPGPNAGILDPEFEAFQAGQPPVLHPEAPHQAFNTFGRPNVHAGPSQAGPSSWASDFQKLSLSSPIHTPVHQTQRPNVAGWHQEFAQQRQQPGAPQGNHAVAQHPLERLSSLAAMPLHMQQPMYPGPSFANHEAALATPPQQEHFKPEGETFDDAAFERAFEEAARSEAIADREEQQVEQTQEEESIQINESAEHLLARELEEPTERIGADLIHDPRAGGNQSLEDQNDPDALARTAGQLLESVSDNTSSKFKKSMFLELMRQLRDKEVKVKGDKIVGVDPGFEGDGFYDDNGYEHQGQSGQAQDEKEASGMAQRRFINDVVYYSQDQIQDYIQSQNQRILESIAEFDTNFRAYLAANPEIFESIIGDKELREYPGLSRRTHPSAILREAVALLVRINRLALPIRNLQTLPSVWLNSDQDVVPMLETNIRTNIHIRNAIAALVGHPFFCEANQKIRERMHGTVNDFMGIAEEIYGVRTMVRNGEMGSERDVDRQSEEDAHQEPWEAVVKDWLADLQMQKPDQSRWTSRRRAKWFISPTMLSEMLGNEQYNPGNSQPPAQQHLHELANKLGSHGERILLLMSLIWLDDRLPPISYTDFQHLLDGWSDEIPVRVNAVASLEKEPLRDLWYLFAGTRGSHINVSGFDTDLLFPSEIEDQTRSLTDEWDGEVGYLVGLARLAELIENGSADREKDMDRVPQGSLSRRKNVDSTREYWAQRVLWEQRQQSGWGWRDGRLEENEYRVLLGEVYDEINRRNVRGIGRERQNEKETDEQQLHERSDTETEIADPDVLQVFKLRDELDYFVADWKERFHATMEVQAH